MNEEFSQGAPCPILPTGALSNYGVYCGERHVGVFFAGTEYSEVWKGYMEEAVHSGKKAAKAVLKDLERVLCVNTIR
jgi:monoamine oxidase